MIELIRNNLENRKKTLMEIKQSNIIKFNNEFKDGKYWIPDLEYSKGNKLIADISLYERDLILDLFLGI